MLGVYRSYIGIMQKKMETTILGMSGRRMAVDSARGSDRSLVTLARHMLQRAVHGHP